MRCAASSALSPSSVKGPRPRMSRWWAGATGVSGGSIRRTRNQAESMVANGANSWRPSERKTRAPASATRSAAAAASGTSIQRSPGSRGHGGRHSVSRGTRVAAHAASALAEMVVAKGWVASTSRSVRCSRRYAAKPSAPWKPPTRTEPASRLGARVRPASDEVTAIAGCAAAHAASAAASAVPPRINTRSGSAIGTAHELTSPIEDRDAHIDAAGERRQRRLAGARGDAVGEG